MKGKSANHESPVDRLKKFPLKHVKFADRYPTHFSIEAVRAEGVAEAFAGDSDGGDYEAMTCERRKSEERHAGTDLINVM